MCPWRGLEIWKEVLAIHFVCAVVGVDQKECISCREKSRLCPGQLKSALISRTKAPLPGQNLLYPHLQMDMTTRDRPLSQAHRPTVIQRDSPSRPL